MPDDREPIEPQMPHEQDTIPCFGSFGRPAMIVGVSRDRGMSKPSKIRAHNSVLAGKDWCHAMPGGMGARVAMQKQDRWPGPAVADAQNRLWELDHLKLEIIKHEGETGDHRTKFQATTISSHLKENYQMTSANTAIPLS
jgi:hypothetical protein